MSTGETLTYRKYLDCGGRSKRSAKGGTLRSSASFSGGAPFAFVVRPKGKFVKAWSSVPMAAGRVHRMRRKGHVWVVYSGSGWAAVRSIESSGDFRRLRERIRGLGRLDKGWDTYDGVAPSAQAVEAALRVVDQLENQGVLPEWVIPTSDASILMRYRVGDTHYVWEFHSDGDVAVMRKPLFDRETYHDLDADGVAAFFSEQPAVR